MKRLLNRVSKCRKPLCGARPTVAKTRGSLWGVCTLRAPRVAARSPPSSLRLDISNWGKGFSPATTTKAFVFSDTLF